MSKKNILEQYRGLNKSKTDNITFRVDPKLKNKIKKDAKKAGESVAEYMSYAAYLRTKGYFDNQIKKECMKEKQRISRAIIQTDLNKIYDGIDIYESVRNIEEEIQSW